MHDPAGARFCASGVVLDSPCRRTARSLAEETLARRHTLTRDRVSRPMRNSPVGVPPPTYQRAAPGLPAVASRRQRLLVSTRGAGASRGPLEVLERLDL